MSNNIKTFGEVKVGDVLYCIDYHDYSMTEIHAAEITKQGSDNRFVTIVVTDEVPNTTEKPYKVETLADRSGSYGVFTTRKEAAEYAISEAEKQIRWAEGEIAEKLLKTIAVGRNTIEKNKAILAEIENDESAVRQRDISYGELADLYSEFDEKVADEGIEFPDDEIRRQCELDFIQQYMNGENCPTINTNW